MKAVFIHRMGPKMASHRYRALIPAYELRDMGNHVGVNEGEADILVFSKPTPDDILLAEKARRQGVKVVADIGDNHFCHATWGHIYRKMISLAHFIVAPTSVMAGIIKKYTDRNVDTVIPDPYEEPLIQPHAGAAKKLLWFGHASNLKDLLPWMEYIDKNDLTIVTSKNSGAIHDYVEWTPEAQTRELELANLVLLPTRKGAEYKSPNRLINSIRAGCFPVCAQHPSYVEFRRFVWTSGLSDGLRWASHFRDDLDELVKEGQSYIEKFSPRNIGKQWAQVLRSL